LYLLQYKILLLKHLTQLIILQVKETIYSCRDLGKSLVHKSDLLFGTHVKRMKHPLCQMATCPRIAGISFSMKSSEDRLFELMQHSCGHETASKQENSGEADPEVWHHRVAKLTLECNSFRLVTWKIHC
jgi:hypothetical protein